MRFNRRTAPADATPMSAASTPDEAMPEYATPDDAPLAELMSSELSPEASARSEGSEEGADGANAEATESDDTPRARRSGGPESATTGRPPRAPKRAEEPVAKPWRVDTANGSLVPRSSLDILIDVNDKVMSGQIADYEAVPLGIPPLDRTIGGGLRPGEMLLIGGAQGTGKTTMALQIARNIAASGQAYVLYVCFEHDEADLLNRLISMESLLPRLPHKAGAVKIQDVRSEVLGTWAKAGEGMPDIASNPKLRPSLGRLARYGHNLFLLRGSATASTVDNLRELIQQHRERSGDRRLVVFVDYLQKVPVIPEPLSEAEKVTTVVNGLKDIALTEHVPVVAIVAADKEGLKATRLRNYHLRGSSAINYEADVILILNEKYQIVAKVNIEFNPYQAQRFRDWIIVSVEKNRAGQDNIELEYEKHFEYSCFDPTGRQVQEKLIEERLYTE